MTQGISYNAVGKIKYLAKKSSHHSPKPVEACQYFVESKEDVRSLGSKPLESSRTKKTT